MNDMLAFFLRQIGFHVHEFGQWKYYETNTSNYQTLWEIRRFHVCDDCGHREDKWVRDGRLPRAWSDKSVAFDRDDLE